MREHLEAINHKEAILFLESLLMSDPVAPVTERDVKDLHSLILKNVDDRYAGRYRDIAVRFVAASLQGWAYCRDNVESCRDIVVGAGSQLGASHQLWQMNEINKLIWPADGGVGFIDQAAWDRTVEIAQSTPNLDGAYTSYGQVTQGMHVVKKIARGDKMNKVTITTK